jgi:hypothetical protein
VGGVSNQCSILQNLAVPASNNLHTCVQNVRCLLAYGQIVPGVAGVGAAGSMHEEMRWSNKLLSAHARQLLPCAPLMQGCRLERKMLANATTDTKSG